MTVPDFLSRLNSVRVRGPGRWSAGCPAHPDKSPSLSIREAGSKLLVRCWAGCETSRIVAALGLELKDLFTDSPTHRRQGSIQKPQKLDLVAVAFRFELGALDRRLRADAVLQAVADFNGDDLSEEDRDRLMNVVARAYYDQERAQFFESVADNFRCKAYEERKEDHAA